MQRRTGIASALLMAAAAIAATPGAVAHSADAPSAVFVSTSGLTHHDIADLRTLPTWRHGDPNSISQSWNRVIDTVWDDVAAQAPTAVFTTGDMVEGRWGVDPDQLGIFGPVDTFAHKEQAVRRAGETYYGDILRREQARSLTVYPGMGDHEIGDINSSGVTKATDFKARAVNAWSSVWRTMNGHPPYYTALLPGNVQLWALRPWMKTANGEIHARVGPRQIDWLNQTMSASTATYRLVQTEIPPYPVERSAASSRLALENGEQLWSMFEQYDVDVVLSAEFHLVNARLGPDQVNTVPHTPVEITHGGRLPYMANYLTIDVFPDRLELQSHTFTGRPTDCTKHLWAPSDKSRPCFAVALDGPSAVTGTMTITSTSGISNISNVAGDLTLE